MDNRTSEFAEWDFDLLETELEGLDFDGFDFGFDIVDDDGFGTDFDLPEGDKAPVQNMTFTFSNDEAQIVNEAISEMKRSEDFKSYNNPENQNSNGNALFLVVNEWLQQKI